MRVLARCNGTLLVETDGRLGLATIGGGWLGTAAFVTALIGLMGLFNGILLLTLTHWIPGAVVTALGALASAATVALLRRRRAVRAAPPPAPYLIFDPAELAGATLKRTFQIGSSSKALTLVLPGRTLVIARGTPFGDSVDAIEDALRRALAR